MSPFAPSEQVKRVVCTPKQIRVDVVSSLHIDSLLDLCDECSLIWLYLTETFCSCLCGHSSTGQGGNCGWDQAQLLQVLSM